MNIAIQPLYPALLTTFMICLILSQVHISQSSTVPDHCRQYALSFPDDSDYISPCDHEHNDRCDRCDLLPSVVRELYSVMENLDATAEKDEMTYVVEQAVIKIDAWKAHLIRSSNQDLARLDILQNLGPKSALLTLDWAMKFLPRKFREAQRDWFAKRGISWHITVAITKSKEGTMQLLSFVHVFEKCSQESDTVLAIIDDVFSQLKSIAPEVTTVFLRQDNAGCYHSASVLLSVQRIANKNEITLSRVDYSDPQGGKGACDRKAATIKGHIKIYLNEGHDVETADQMVTAMESKSGIPGVRVTLCGQQSSDTAFPTKLEGISFLNNAEYNKDGVRVWKAYRIGPGKYLPWSEFNQLEKFPLPQLNTTTGASHSNVSFTDVAPRRKHISKTADQVAATADTSKPEEEDVAMEA